MCKFVRLLYVILHILQTQRIQRL